MRFFLFPCFVLISLTAFSQSVSWEKTYARPGFSERAKTIISTSFGYLIFCESRYGALSTSDLELIEIDSAGNPLRRSRFLNGSFARYPYSAERIPNEDYYLLTGALLSTNQIFISKIDEHGDTLWLTALDLYGGFGAGEFEILPDKSAIVCGTKVSASSSADIGMSRIDSSGNILWSKTLNLPKWQTGSDITYMQDGSIIATGATKFWKYGIIIVYADIDGNIINTESYQFEETVNPWTPTLSSLLPNKKMGMVILGGNTGSFENNYCEITTNQTTIHFDSMDRFCNEPIILEDSIYFFNTLYENTSHNDMVFELEKRHSPLDPPFWQMPYGFHTSVSGTNIDSIKFAETLFFTEESVILAGSREYNSLSWDIWTMKVDNIGRKWKPDPCEFYPPSPKIHWDYEYPYLRLRDSSFSGMIYHDSIYSRSWSSSQGDTSSLEEMSVYWDTASSNKINIILEIENFNQCYGTDSIIITKSVNGLRERPNENIEFSVFPNPAKEKLNYKIETAGTEFKTGDISIRSLNGSLINKTNITSNSGTIDLNSIEPGIYIITVNTGERIAWNKFIKR